jgi:hypothetical protein
MRLLVIDESATHGGGERKVSALEPLGVILALASATLLMVLAGMAKNHLVWQRRHQFFRRRR